MYIRVLCLKHSEFGIVEYLSLLVVEHSRSTNVIQRRVKMSVQTVVSREELVKKLNAQLQLADKLPKAKISKVAIEHEIKAQSQYFW
jgi:hypothetical protein